MDRIDKLLCSTGRWSRKEVKELVRQGRVQDGGRTVLRPSLPYDETCRIASCFLDLYIGARYAPSPSVPGCLCHATVIYGTVSLTAEGQTFQLLERDALRFAADRPYHFENMSSGTGRLLLEYQYLRGHM